MRGKAACAPCGAVMLQQLAGDAREVARCMRTQLRVDAAAAAQLVLAAKLLRPPRVALSTAHCAWYGSACECKQICSFQWQADYRHVTMLRLAFQSCSRVLVQV